MNLKVLKAEFVFIYMEGNFFFSKHLDFNVFLLNRVPDHAGPNKDAKKITPEFRYHF